MPMELERKAKVNSFQTKHCLVCERSTWHYRETCCDHSAYPRPNSLGGMPVVSDDAKPKTRLSVAPTHLTTRKASPDKRLGFFDANVKPDNVLCIGCAKEVSKAFTTTGRVWARVNFVTTTKSRMVWNPVTDETSIVLEDKAHPYDSYRKGWLCCECVSDYSMIEHKHRDGSVTYTPKVIPDVNANHGKTIVPMYESIESVNDSKPVDPMTGLFVKESPDANCYRKFGSKGRG